MNIAYLVNQYPAVSHTFVKREILEVERKGKRVFRYSITPSANLVDEQDKSECLKTTVVLKQGTGRIVISVLSIFIRNPLIFIGSAFRTVIIGMRSDRGWFRHVAYFIEACFLACDFKKKGITHVHSHFGTNSTMVALIVFMLKGPSYSFTIHGPDEFDKAELLSLNVKVSQAKFVVVISEYSKSQLQRWCSRDHWKKIHVIHCGVDNAFLEVKSKKSSIVNDRLLSIGRLCEQKGYLTLIAALGLVDRKGYDFKCVIAGEGPMRGVIEKAVYDSGLKEKIELIGSVDSNRIIKEILYSKALVLPSYAEGLPVVFMEALALRRAVLSTFVAGIPELIIPKKNGWLVPAGSICDLSRAIIEVLNKTDSEVYEMGCFGRDKVVREFNCSIEVDKLIRLFE